MMFTRQLFLLRSSCFSSHVTMDEFTKQVTSAIKSTMHVDLQQTRIIHKKTTHYNHALYSIVHQNFDSSKSAIPCAAMLAVEETVLLIPIPSYTATTLIVQLLPGGREEKV